MICPECANGKHGECRTNQRWGQPTKTGLSPVARDVQKRTWCFCQHRVEQKWPSPREAAEAVSWPVAVQVAQETFDAVEKKREELAIREVNGHGIPPLPPETVV